MASPLPPALRMTGVHKRYGSTLALDGVDLSVAPGEVHAVIGENGAGKSTLMKILCGVVEPDRGEITLGGAPYRPQGPAHAARNGLAMIHQELTLAPHLTVEANILLGMERCGLGFLRKRENVAIARSALAQLGRADIDPSALVRSISIGEQQIVEIARALAAQARIIVMDEPTSSLTAEDRAHLFAAIRTLRDRGMSIIYISHFLEEVREICDGYTVLRDGHTVGTGRVADATESQLIELMVGRKISDVFPRGARSPGAPILRVTELSGRRSPRGVCFELRRGEILGLAGLIGAGRTESLRSIFGLDPMDGGEIQIAEGRGGPARPTPASSVRAGLGFLSEDRKLEGLALGLSIQENIVLSSPERISRFGFVRAGESARASRHWMGELAVKAQGPGQPVGGLSGGNQQKVAIARLLQQEADVFLLDEPTRGIDIGSKVEIYRLMDGLAQRGKAVIFVSSYLPELMGVCDRIGVMSRGRLVEIRPVSDWDDHTIMAAATGAKGEA